VLGPSVYVIPAGTYEPTDDLDKYTKKLIKNFRQNSKAKEHDPLYKITPDEWRSFCKGAAEWTSCGCEILHLGTWKTGSFSETKT
jgi:hypothetical protein